MGFVVSHLSRKNKNAAKVGHHLFTSLNKHTIPVAEEAVVLLDGVAIGGENRLAPGEGADQHQQARLGQVEVGEQGVDEAELETGGDEDFRFAGVRLERMTGGLERAVFEGTDDGGTDSDDAAAFGFGAVNGFGGGGSERVALAVQADFVHALHAQRGKGAQADVEGEAGNFDAASGERVEDLRSEVQPGRGRGDGAAFTAEDRLVALAVGGGVVTADVGRQRDVADAVERGEEVIDRVEAQQALAEEAALQHLGFESDGAVGRGKD